MATWTGWENQLLSAAGLPTTKANRAFLDAWNKHAGTNCGNNPIDLSYHESGSSDCHKLNTSLTAQKYASHASAARAFHDEISDVAYNPLFFGFTDSSLDPHNASPDVIANVQRWGSTLFANYLFNEASVGTSGTGGVAAPGIHEAWSHLQRSVNHTLPRAFSDSRKLTNAALRSLHKARKVHL